MKTEDIKSKLLERTDRSKTVVPSKDLLSTGSTLVNLACSGRVAGAYAKGSYVFFVGDSESGKTFLALTCFAEANRNRNFADYRLIYDNVEDGALMDWAAYFGPTAAERIEAPSMKADAPVYSETVEDFYYHIDDAHKAGRPFIYVLDSMDALVPRSELEKFKKQKAASRNNKEEAGDYGTAKAKLNSHHLRLVLPKLKAMGSILIIISQTRDSLATFGFGEKKTRAGGKALKFYATLEIWTSVRDTLRKTVGGKPRAYGITTQVDIKKNRLQGKKRRVFVPILHDYGIDDVGSCVDYLLDEGHWKETSGKIHAPEFSEEQLSRTKLIRKIEDEESERELRKIVADKWNSIEAELKTNRKARYE